MRKSFLIVPILCAVFLVACTGGQKHNNGSQTAEVGDSAEIVSENSETESEIQTNIAEEIFKNNGGQANEVGDTVGFVYEIPEAELRKHINYAKEIFKKVFPSVNCENGGTVIGHKNGGTIIGYTYKIEVTGGGRRIYCYPKNDGGYLVVKEEVDYHRNCMGGHTFAITSYKDGDLYRDDIGALPLPKLEMLLNPDKISGHESDIAAFKAMYDENPRKYLDYDCQPPDILKVELYPWICFDAVCNMDQCMLWSGHQDQLLEYTWDGTQFVVNPETVPSTNLESIIGSDDNSTVAMRFWKKMLKKYDPIGRLEGDEVPSAEMIAGNLKRIKEESGNVAVYEAEGVEGFTETAACYPQKDGSWIVLLYWSSNDSPNHKLNAYNFDGSNITRLENYFPDDFLADGRYISSLDTDEFAVVSDTDEEEIVDWYKWNGEEFVKQSDD